MDGDTYRHDFKHQRGILLGCSEILPADTAASDELRNDLEEIHTGATAALDVLARLLPDRPRRRDEGHAALLTGLHRSTR
jgi:hypothetical protein